MGQNTRQSTRQSTTPCHDKVTQSTNYSVCILSVYMSPKDTVKYEYPRFIGTFLMFLCPDMAGLWNSQEKSVLLVLPDVFQIPTWVNFKYRPGNATDSREYLLFLVY